MNDAAYWLVVYLSSGSEKKFAKWLTERAVSVYYPMRKIYTKPKRKKKAVTRDVPAFPGYAFVKVWAGKKANWYVLRSAPGFLYAVSEMDGSEETDEPMRRPLFVPDEEIQYIMTMEKKGKFDGVSLSLVFSKGTPIQITEGAFEGRIGHIEVPPKSEETSAVAVIEGTKLKISVSLLRIIQDSRHPGRLR